MGNFDEIPRFRPNCMINSMTQGDLAHSYYITKNMSNAYKRVPQHGERRGRGYESVVGLTLGRSESQVTGFRHVVPQIRIFSKQIRFVPPKF